MSPTTDRRTPKAAITDERKTRTERDSMGEMNVPAHAHYGATTQREVLNFPVSGRPLPGQVIHAYALLKKSCAEVNVQLKKVDADTGWSIVQACDTIIEAFEDG